MSSSVGEWEGRGDSCSKHSVYDYSEVFGLLLSESLYLARARRPSDITVFYYNFGTLKEPGYPQSVYGQ